MTRLMIYGASGRTGRHLVPLAMQTGWSVHAVGRDPVRLSALGEDISWSVVDANDVAAVGDLVGSVQPEAIVSLIGGSLGNGFIDEVGNVVISDAARRAGIRRVIQVSSLGCGDSRAYASDRLLAAIGPVLAAKTHGEDHLRELDIDWTIVRPGGLTDGDMTGGGRFYDDPRVHGRISRADLAALLCDCLRSTSTIRKILSAIDRSTLSGPGDVRQFPMLVGN